MAEQKAIQIAIYNHPEAYPPTLNAIDCLSTKFDSINVTYRPNKETVWVYPKNVRLSYWKKKESDNPSLPSKISQFFSFCFKLLKSIRSNQPQVVLLYDSIALYAYYLIRRFIPHKHTLWYHNHDIPLYHNIRKYSIGWFASRVHEKIFDKIDLFTLPAEDRLRHFPMSIFTGKCLIIPNYPSQGKYNSVEIEKKDLTEVRVLFQGMITSGRGINEIAEYIGKSNINLKLVLAGNLDNAFFKSFMKYVGENNLKSNVTYIGSLDYQSLISETVKHHIGLATLSAEDANYATAATASNKIYEYAACGLPVLYFDNEHYNKHLDQFDWAVKTDLSTASLQQAIAYIVDNYEALSAKARNDFTESLNFEKVFEPVQEYLNCRPND